MRKKEIKQKMSRVLQVLEVLGEDSCLMFILQHADSAMGLVFASCVTFNEGEIFFFGTDFFWRNSLLDVVVG